MKTRLLARSGWVMRRNMLSPRNGTSSKMAIMMRMELRLMRRWTPMWWLRYYDTSRAQRSNTERKEGMKRSTTYCSTYSGRFADDSSMTINVHAV